MESVIPNYYHNIVNVSPSYCRTDLKELGESINAISHIQKPMALMDRY